MSNISVDYDVLNQKGSPAWFSDVFANLPTAGYKGRMFISTDTFAFYRDTGTGWDLIGGPGTGTLTGSGVSGQVSFFNGTQTITGNNNLFWDNTNGRLGIGTATPGASLDIHSTGTNAQFNGTGTNNAYLVFQNAGSSKWRIGNNYNGGANSFDLYNNTTTSTIFSVNSNNTFTFSTSVFANFGIALKDVTGINSNGNLGLGSTGTGLSLGMNVTTTNYFVLPTSVGYSYTFPATTGTIALTSNLSSYLPLSGGTLTGTLNGTSANFSQNVILDNGTTGIPLAFKQYSSAGFLGSNYTSLYALTNSLAINFGNPSASIILNTLTLSAGRTITFPDADGTLALTSNLSSYLPLTGGTLTGALVINPTNTLTIGLDVASNTTRFRSDNLEGNKRQLQITMGSGTLIQFTASGYLANYGTDLAFYTATTSGVNASPGIYITGTNNRVGMGTGSPASALTIQAPTSANPNTGGLSFNLSNGTTYFTIGVNNSSGDGSILAGSGGGITFHTNSDMATTNQRMKITSGGNVLIGTNTDNGNKLQVIGSNISTDGYFLGTTTATISALNTSVLLYSGAVSGIISLRDNTNGGSIAWLQDPNGGNITIANNLVNGTIICFQSAGNTYIQKTTGSVPVVVQWVGLMQ